MFKKIKYIMVLAALSVSVSLMSNTYSRYVADTTGSLDIEFATWQILVNNSDITDNTSTDITFTPTIEPNANVAENVVAPSSKGYFDIEINPANVNVSFDYSVTLQIENLEVPDLIISKYAILDNDYVEGDAITTENMVGNTITDSLAFDKTIDNFKFDPFTIRVYFEWYDEADNVMNDEEDTVIGHEAATTGKTFRLNATIDFTQQV